MLSVIQYAQVDLFLPGGGSVSALSAYSCICSSHFLTRIEETEIIRGRGFSFLLLKGQSYQAEPRVSFTYAVNEGQITVRRC